jgi:hypothetical protein
MKSNLPLAALLIGSLMVGQALADCPGPNAADKKCIYQQAGRDTPTAKAKAAQAAFDLEKELGL